MPSSANQTRTFCAVLLLLGVLVGLVAFGVYVNMEWRRERINRKHLASLSSGKIESALHELEKHFTRPRITDSDDMDFVGTGWEVRAIKVRVVTGASGSVAAHIANGAVLESDYATAVLSPADLRGAARDLSRVLVSERARLATDEDVEAVRALWEYALPWRQEVFVEQTIPEPRITIVSYGEYSVYSLDILVDSDGYVQSASFHGDKR